MTLLLVLVAIAVVGAVAVLVVRDRPVLTEDPSASPWLEWDPQAENPAVALDRVRFAVAARGYRMDQVDRVLDDLARTLGEQQARIAELEGQGDLRHLSDPGDDAASAPARDSEEVLAEQVLSRAPAARQVGAAADPQDPASH